MKRSLSLLLAALMIVALCGSAFAAGEPDFVNSVEKLVAPEALHGEIVGPDFKVYEDLTPSTQGGRLVITPYCNRSKAEIKEIEEMLDAAFGDIEADKANSCLKDPADWTAVDLFDVYVIDTEHGKYAELLDGSGKYCLSVTFKVDITEDVDNLKVIYCCDGSKWKEIPESRIVVNGDGTVTVGFWELCPVVFLRPAAAGDTSTGEIKKENGPAVMAIVAAAAASGCGAVGVIGKKKKNSVSE